MKALRIAAAATLTFCLQESPAQVRSSGRGGIAGGHFPGGVTTPFRHRPAGGSFHSGSSPNRFGRPGFGGRFRNGFGVPYGGFNSFDGYNSFFDPFYASYAGFGNDEEYQQPAQPGIVLLMPQVTMPPPPEPAAPIRPEVREYNWPVSSPDSTAAFTLVRKDQRVESAIAVTTQGNRILYVTPDGSYKQMSMDTLDRERTRLRNAEKNLRLPWL